MVEWLADLDEGKRRAAQQHKDLFINFTGTEWCFECVKLMKEVLDKPDFAAAAGEFVLVELEFHGSDDDLRKETGGKYIAWREEYGIRAFPTVILADATGHPYAITGNIGVGAKEYVEHLRSLRSVHKRQRAAFAKAVQSQGIPKARCLDEGLSALQSVFPEHYTELQGDPLVRFYRPEIDQILSLDADNSAGLRDKYRSILDAEAERQRIAEFYARVGKARRELGDRVAVELVDQELERTKSTKLRNRFRIVRLGVLEDRHDEALDYAQDLLKDESFSAEDRRWLRDRIAFHLWRLGRIDDAVAVYDGLIADAGNPKAAWSRYQDKAMALFRAGRISQSLETWEVPLKAMEPGTIEWRETQGFRAWVMEMAGRYDDAVAVRRSILSRCQGLDALDRAGALASLARCLRKSGHRAEALETARRAKGLLTGLEVRGVDKRVVQDIQDEIKVIQGETEGKTLSEEKTREG